MGTIHKFNRPPKNEKQFRGYRPKVKANGAVSDRRRRMPPWLLSVIAWTVLVLLAVGWWAIDRLLG